MIAKTVGAGFVILAIPLLAIFVLVALIGGAVSASSAAAGQTTFNPSEEAINDIPPALLDAYIRAASQCVGLPWQVLAGIGKVESNHGRFGGATIGADGRVIPPIIGIPLDGTNSTAAIRDTDDGIHDGDTVWDRAVGPFQFIPTSWAIFGQDGNGDGNADPQNMLDAIPSAVAHLCPTGTITDIEAAIFSYNHSLDYVALVLDWATRYTGPLASAGAVIGGYAYPLPAGFATETIATRSHHTYPAIDIGAPVGTNVYTMVGGTVTAAIGDAGIYNPGSGGRCGNTITISGVDGATYTYCHLAAVLVAPGQSIAAGQQIGLTGGSPGAAGAGNTTAPHLHLGIRAYGQSICPQPLLLGILRGTPIPPTAAPVSGCVTPGRATDWSSWLNNLGLSNNQGALQ